ncbi:MAG: D-galactonate dehydratase, partial [Chloroflexi bacterium]|nr:D-galactonate dehydratase [Chloroflexota bacterium]
MKITRVDQFAPRNRTRLVRISTDTGIEGWGETTLEGKPRSVPAAIDEMTDYL